MTNIIHAADLFCGAGGTSTGLIEAGRSLGLQVKLFAVNHWDIAIATHSANHPDVRHMCASLETVNPRELFREGSLELMWASPECMHHSIARGGKPINDQSRSTAWHVVQWAEALRPRAILIENVKEFQTWGPIGSNGRPMKSRRGEIFQSWVKCLESLGYTVEWKTLCAADYGDPTTRQRLFVQAIRGKRTVTWPKPTHAPTKKTTNIFGDLKPWRPAKEIIDWTLRGQSIFERKRPLSPKTLKRIEAGLAKYGLKPFLVPGQGDAKKQKPRTHDVEQPTPTVTAQGHLQIVEPFLVKFRGQSDAVSIENPIPALTAGGGHLGLAEPFLIQVNRTNGDRVRSVKEPLPTICGNGEHALIEPMIIPHTGGGRLRPVSEPVATVMPGSRSMGLIQPYLVKFYSSGESVASVDDPLATVTTKERFGLVRPVIVINGEKYLLDILFRMLQPHELAAAQGFPKDYKFTGTKTEIVKQIGNAVPVNLAKALCAETIRNIRSKKHRRAEVRKTA